MKYFENFIDFALTAEGWFRPIAFFIVAFIFIFIFIFIGCLLILTPFVGIHIKEALLMAASLAFLCAFVFSILFGFL